MGAIHFTVGACTRFPHVNTGNIMREFCLSSCLKLLSFPRRPSDRILVGASSVRNVYIIPLQQHLEAMKPSSEKNTEILDAALYHPAHNNRQFWKKVMSTKGKFWRVNGCVALKLQFLMMNSKLISICCAHCCNERACKHFWLGI